MLCRQVTYINIDAQKKINGRTNTIITLQNFEDM